MGPVAQGAFGAKVDSSYGKQDGVESGRIEYFYNLFKDKKYCILVFLKNSQKVKPFEINKSGFGAMSAWITVEDIAMLKKLGAEGF